MLQSYPAHVLGATLLCLGGCATTTFTSTWKAADGQTINPAGKTIATVFVSGDERNRHAAEDALAKDLNARGAHGVPGYTLLPNEIRGDAEDILARLKEAGANEVVLMRVVSADKQPSFTEVRWTASMVGWTASNGDEARGASNATGVTELRHFDTLVSVETLVCSLDRDEPLWSSTSRTTNPKDIENLVNEVADATAKEMVKQGLLARQ
jgi:hypothetical protein